MAPSVTTLADYFGYDSEDPQSWEWSEAELESALLSESASQARRCRVPAPDAEWPADLTEALCRRVAANLANRALPLGMQASITEQGMGYVRVGGLDREVRRLEGPFRKVVAG